jgi:hypothetical protein
MTNGDDPDDTEFEQASSQLDQGLKSCRSVLNNYRAILSDDHAENDNNGSLKTDIGGDASPSGVSPEDQTGFEPPRPDGCSTNNSAGSIAQAPAIWRTRQDSNL